MKILFLTDNFPPERNATASRVYERAVYWVKWGHQVTVITGFPNFPEGEVYPGYQNRWFDEEEMDGIRVLRVKTYITANTGNKKRIFDFLSFMVSAFFRGLFLRKFNLVISTSPQFFTAVAAWALSKVRRETYIFELGDLWPASIAAVGAMQDSVILRWLEKLELYLYHQAKAIIALTNDFKQNLISRGISQEKIEVIINGVDLNRYQPLPKDQDLMLKYGLQDKLVIGYIGTHGMAHGLENVLDTAELLQQKKETKAHFLFVGAGAEKKKLVNMKQSKKLSNVTFIPAQPKETIKHYWGLCDFALIHLKKHDLFRGVIPSKIFEAMGMGLPILFVGPEGEGSQIIVKENAGVIIPPGNPESFAIEIEKIIKGERPCNEWKRKSLAAAPNYSREKQAKHMIGFIESQIPS